MDIKQIVLDLCALSDEQEWFEFKENWFQPEALGEYVSALSNAAAFHYKKYAYFIWGVNDTTHEIVGTTFNQYCEYNKEPYQNYLARNLSPRGCGQFYLTIYNSIFFLKIFYYLLRTVTIPHQKIRLLLIALP